MKKGRIPQRTLVINALVNIPMYAEIPYPHGKDHTSQQLRDLLVTEALIQFKRMVDNKALFHHITIEDSSLVKLIDHKIKEKQNGYR